MYEFSVLRADEDVTRDVAALFTAEGNPRSDELFSWQYLCPHGGAYVGLARHRGAQVAHPDAAYSVFPSSFQYRGRHARAVQSFDTLTSEAARGSGLFVTLANAVYDRCSAEGCVVVYGFPNANSVRGFRSRLNWQIMDPLPMWVRNVGTRFVGGKIGLRKPSVLESMNSGSRVDIPADVGSLFEDLLGTDGIGVVRDDDYLSWRLSRPHTRYRTYAERKAGETVVFGATEIVLKHGAAVGYIMELMVDQSAHRAGSEVLGQMVKDLKRRGADLILMWAPPICNLNAILVRHGFVPFPERVRPIALHFGAAPLAEGVDVGPRSRWFISYLDSDTV